MRAEEADKLVPYLKCQDYLYRRANSLGYIANRPDIDGETYISRLYLESQPHLQTSRLYSELELYMMFDLQIPIVREIHREYSADYLLSSPEVIFSRRSHSCLPTRSHPLEYDADDELSEEETTDIDGELEDLLEPHPLSCLEI